ncbi:MAG: hypothetical protein J7L07_07640 [Candidatus Odinarchaeota archaeon]|nr:hypothetical protein [Candidatus Odinarchaeota archaeon]
MLRRVCLTNGKAVIKGLRGIGKTTIMKRLCDEFKGIYIDFQNILRPKHLAMVIRELTGRTINCENPHACLEEMFKVAYELKKPLFLDEFIDLIARFGLMMPYRGSGGSDAVAMHFRSLLQKYDIPIIISATSLKTLSEITGRYTKPLARAFDVILTLHPLKLHDAVKLAYQIAESLGISISDDVALKIAEISGGNPDYIKAIIYKLPKVVNSVDILLEYFERELREGYFAALFSGLRKELSPSEFEVLTIISRGNNRYSEISRLTTGINLNETLTSLLDRGLVEKVILSKKDSRYIITDKTFEAWLALLEFPGLKRISMKRLQVSTLSFEALIRELFMTIDKTIELKDFTGKPLTIDKVSKVYRYSGALGEIDAIVITKTQKIVLEIYFGNKCPEEKLNQLLKNIAIAEKVEGAVDIGILISYFGFSKELVQKSKGFKNIFLLSEREINLIASKTKYRQI